MLRRTLGAVAAVLALLPASALFPAKALAQAAPTELVIAIVPAENSSGTVDRYTPVA